MSRPKLAKADQVYWLQQHIMTRMFAVMAKRSRLRELQRSHPRNSLVYYELEHIFHATWEGQHAAMRWLIELAGVEASKNSNIVTIEQFDGGELITPSHQHYRELKEVWGLCSEVTSHPTRREQKPGEVEKNHIRLSEERLHASARILREHFKEVYEKAGIPI